ncbi:hypothetical protein SLEP1_g60209, partial [Rubroshorea leprosula]
KVVFKAQLSRSPILNPLIPNPGQAPPSQSLSSTLGDVADSSIRTTSVPPKQPVPLPYNHIVTLHSQPALPPPVQPAQVPPVQPPNLFSQYTPALQPQGTRLSVIPLRKGENLFLYGQDSRTFTCGFLDDFRRGHKKGHMKRGLPSLALDSRKRKLLDRASPRLQSLVKSNLGFGELKEGKRCRLATKRIIVTAIKEHHVRAVCPNAKSKFTNSLE